MTVVIGYVEKNGDIWLGADTAASYDTILRQVSEPKVFIRDDIAFGVAGRMKLIQVLKYFLEIPDRANFKSDDEYVITQLMPTIRECLIENYCTIETEDGEPRIESEGLIGYKGNLYYYGGEMMASKRQSGMEAIGSGGEVAYGAMLALPPKMNAEKKIMKALQISEQCNISVRGPFDILKLER